MKKSNFFTMIELLAAVALMVLLAGIGFAGYSYAMNAAKESATKSLIARIGAGLEAVRNKHGFYPVSASYGTIVFTPDTSTGLITSVTMGTSTTPLTGVVLKDFLAIVDAETLKKFVNKTSHLLEDSWGENIRYCYPGKVNTTKFDIIAPGPDNKFGIAKDLAPKETPPTGKTAVLSNYQDDNNEWACDDIANFQ